MTEHCLSCHETRESPRLTSQSLILSSKASILDSAVYTDFMPESESISTAEREMLGEWLACGAP